MNQKLLTAAVVFLGIGALAVGAKFGVSAEVLAAGASALLFIAGSLRSMLPEKK